MGILVVGSLNMDYILQVEALPQAGETIFAGGYSTSPGGKGANQAVAAARLGSSVSMIGRLGGDVAGAELIASLSMAGVQTSELEIEERAATGAAYITVARDGMNTIVVHQGANSALQPKHILKAKKAIAEAKVVVAQLEIASEAVTQAFKLAKEDEKVTVLNPAPAKPLRRELLALVDWLIPNETEAISLLRSLGSWGQADQKRVENGLDAGFALEMAERLAKITKAHLIITLGALGCVYAHPQDKEGILFPAFPVQAVDTTAAGDAFVGALASGINQGIADLRELISFTQAAAALTVTKLGAQPSLPTKAEVEQFLRAPRRF